MKVIEKGILTDGTAIQIEDWSENYSFYCFAGTIASYPISKMTHAGAWAPKAGETYRFSFTFNTTEEAKETFEALNNGKMNLSDLREHMDGKREYRNCI